MARLTLLVFVLFPAIGLSVNLIWPPPVHGYEIELVQLIALGLCALWLSRYSAQVAMLLYCILALLPAFSMLEYHARILSGEPWWPIMSVPVVGLVAMVAVTGCSWATYTYIPVAVAGGLVAGNIYGDAGASGVLAGGVVVVGVIAIALCKKREGAGALGAAMRQIETIQRGLDGLQEEIDGRK